MFKLGPVGLAAFLAVMPASWSAPAEAPSRAVFQAFIEAIWPEAQAEGVSRKAFDEAFAGLSPDPAVAAMTRRQPEELKTVGAYLDAAVTPARIAAGRAMLARWGGPLAAIARNYGVPGAIVVAVWGLETNYGAASGNKDVIRSLATLGAIGDRPDLYRTELLAALALLQRGEVTRAALKGSWAGAMGQPQFMPSSYATYAVDGDGDGRRDIWDDVPDSLASIANFLRRQGWRPGQPWGFEVKLPLGFDLRKSRATYADWAAAGVSRADGAAMPPDGEATLLFPAGAKGPPLLVTENYEVLKTYNFSDVYVLSVGQLADRMEGASAIVAPWPQEPPISRAARIALQARLAALGYAIDNRQGRISLALRDVIRAAQLRVGMAPDGNPTEVLVRALQTLAVGR